MRIKLLTGVATMTRVYDSGSVVDWPDRADAERLIRAGCAEAVAEENEYASAHKTRR